MSPPMAPLLPLCYILCGNNAIIESNAPSQQQSNISSFNHNWGDPPPTIKREREWERDTSPLIKSTNSNADPRWCVECGWETRVEPKMCVICTTLYIYMQTWSSHSLKKHIILSLYYKNCCMNVALCIHNVCYIILSVPHNTTMGLNNGMVAKLNLCKLER